MTDVIIILHVLAALVFLGPVTVAGSLFPRAARQAAAGDAAAIGSARTLHDLTSTYTLYSLAVPLLGFGAVFMPSDNSVYLRSGWVHLSLLLTVIGWALLFFLVIPAQTRIMDALAATDEDAASVVDGQAGKATAGVGVFALLWVIVFVLMWVKPMNKVPEVAAALGLG